VSVIHARDLPEGTRVEHDGQIWVAWPPAEICGQLIRWHSETGLASDRGMDSMLDDGAEVLGE
jgi:Flp pilus assembly protein CpaB